MVNKDCRCCRDYCMVIEALGKERGISQLYGPQLQSHKTVARESYHFEISMSIEDQMANRRKHGGRKGGHFKLQFFIVKVPSHKLHSPRNK